MNKSGYKLGDKIQILLHSRCRGVIDTGGGWSSDWMDGTVVKINPVNIIVHTNQYYFGYYHSVPLRRVRKLEVSES
jgi:hypothetical protein